MESFNGNTLRFREKVVRGIKKDDSSVLKGMQIHHNFIRPHQSLNGNTQQTELESELKAITSGRPSYKMPQNTPRLVPRRITTHRCPSYLISRKIKSFRGCVLQKSYQP